MDVNNLFNGEYPVEGVVLGVETPEPQRAITSLPDDFEIRTKSDIRTLMEFVAINYTLGIRLYRGHESRKYRLESTIVREAKKQKSYSKRDVLNAEREVYDSFCKDVFKDEWIQHKTKRTNDCLFKLSIGRHLGLPCRLIDVTASLETAVWFAVMNPHYYNEEGEIVLMVLDKEKALKTNGSPFNTVGVSYSHEPFLADSLDDLPLGEQRRFVQNGHFLWVDDDSLLNEEKAITDFAFCVKRFKIPWQAKLPLAIELYRDVYSGCAYQSKIAIIKTRLSQENNF